MSVHWNERSLADVIDVASGQVDPTTEPYAGMPHVGGDNIESNTGRFVEIKTARELGLKSGKYIFDASDVLYSKIRPKLNKVALPDFQGICSADMYPLRPKNGSITREFLVYLLRSKRFLAYAEKHSTRTDIPKLNRETLLAYEVPLPPVSEQKRIAGILDKADAIRRKRQQAIGLTEQFLRSTFLDMFGDPVTNPHGYHSQTLGELCTDLQNGIGKNKEAYGTGEKVANIGDLYTWHTFTPVKFSLLDVTPKEIAKYKLVRGDLLFVRSSLKREGVAYCSAYDSDETCLFSSFMIRARPDQSLIEPPFLSLQRRTPALRLRLVNAANTSTITNISQDGLAAVEVLVPPIDRQNDFLMIMKKAEAMMARAQSRAVDYDSLFNSLVQRAFRGEL